MSSASAGQLDTYLSLKSTPEVEVNSLQLNKQHTSISPHIKSESPLIDDSLFSDPTKLGLSHLGNRRNDVSEHGKIANIDKESSEQNPDDTIQNTANTLPNDDTRLDFPPKQNPSNDESSVKTENAPRLSTMTKIEAVALGPNSNEDIAADNRQDSVLDSSKVSAYARLEFENFIFYVQTLQVVLGRKSEHDQSHSVDVHLGNSKAISRKHAKIFYNFGTERFELSIQGKNGAFVDDVFVERGATVPLTNKSKIQIGQIVFRFVLPGMNHQERLESPSKPINPSDAISLRSTLYTNHSTDGLHDEDSNENTPQLTSKDFEPVSTVPVKPSQSVASPLSGPASTPAPVSNAVATDGLTEATAAAKKVKEKKVPKPPKPPKKVYTLEEIPEEFRTKPACSYSNLIATCLRTHGTPKGMSLAEIYKSIREIFPYYKYCPDGWQSSVRHNLSLNKAFRKVSKEGKGWLWGLDEEYCAEKERQKKKQQAAAAAKAKAAALKLEQQQQQQQKLQQQRLEQQKQLQMAQASQQQFPQQGLPGQIGQNLVNTSLNAQSLPLTNITGLSNQVSQGQQLLNTIGQINGLSGASAISELDSQKFSNIPLQAHTPQPSSSQQFQQPFPNQPISNPQFPLQGLTSQLPQQTTLNQQSLGQAQAQLANSQFPIQLPPQQQVPDPSQIPVFKSSKTQPPPLPQQPTNKTPSIQAQLAANRGVSVSSTPSPSIPKPAAKPAAKPLGADTRKALAHLQQQLVLLSKDLRKLVDKPTISAILTQAIAMTIAQVTQAAKTKGITTDPLATLIETNPSQLTRILTLALNAASYKVTNGRIKNPLTLPPANTNSNTSSRASTPVPSNPSLAKTNVIKTQPSTPSVSIPQVPNSKLSVPTTVQTPPISHPVPSPASNPSSSAPAPAPAPAPNYTSSASTVDQAPVMVAAAQTPAVQQSDKGITSTSNSSSAALNSPSVSDLPTPMVHQSSALQQPAVVTSAASSGLGTPLAQSGEKASPPMSVSAPLHSAPSTTGQDQTSTLPHVNITNTQNNQTATPPHVNSVSSEKPLATSAISPLVASTPGNSSETVSPGASVIKSQAPVEEQKPSDTYSKEIVVESAPQDHPNNVGLSTTQENVNTQVSGTPAKQDIVDNAANLKNEGLMNKTSNALDLLEDDLNDPEFDKVLRSLSKEGTPSMEDEVKGMNDDELNRLLSSDFGHAPEPSNNKRSFDDVETSGIEESNKLPKL